MRPEIDVRNYGHEAGSRSAHHSEFDIPGGPLGAVPGPVAEARGTTEASGPPPRARVPSALSRGPQHPFRPHR
jgi:hypothetical protein